MPITEPLCPYVATSAEYRPDRFYRYAELTELLRAWESAYPQLATLGSIGRTYQGRELWCMTLTNAATGPHDHKPAYYIDANVHAGEVTGSAVALYTIHHLLSQYGDDPLCTRLLDEMTLYVVPRVSADGAELYLEGPGMLRSSVRPYPDTVETRGLVRQDVNGDGWSAMMRLKDPSGPWKVSTKDPRLMVRRRPDETGGTYYWLLPEGLIHGYEPTKDGLLGEITTAASRYGLDLNRNFPIDWEPEHQTRGAGPYPLSEPETRAIADFLLAHSNITGTQHYHTFAGMILRPSSRRSDSTLPPADLKRFQALGRLGTEETGYPCISIYHEFTEEA
ncbi:MAG TPA: M14 family metallopeptidase, partial [Oscillatoriaceae cyanobacterium]